MNGALSRERPTGCRTCGTPTFALERVCPACSCLAVRDDDDGYIVLDLERCVRGVGVLPPVVDAWLPEVSALADDRGLGGFPHPREERPDAPLSPPGHRTCSGRRSLAGMYRMCRAMVPVRVRSSKRCSVQLGRLHSGQSTVRTP